MAFYCSATSTYAIISTDTNYIDFYQKEYNRVYKNYEKNPNSIEVMVEMAEFYSAINNPMRNYSKAIGYIADAETRYIALVNDNSKYKEVNKLIKRKITISSIRKQKQHILDRTAKYVKTSDMSLQECEEYMQAFESYASIKHELEKVLYGLEYARCLNVNTVSAYVTFAKKYPNSVEKTEALLKAQQYILSDIENSETVEKVERAVEEYTNDTIAKCAMKKKAKIEYRDAIKLNTVEGYKAFLSKYPSSDEYMMALDKMDKLIYNDFTALKTPVEYAVFAQNNTESPLADQAMDSIVDMILTDKSIEALDVYLAHFPLDHRYNDVLQAFYRRHIVEGSSSPIAYFASQYPDYPFTYSLSNDLERTRAFDSLNLMQPFDEKNIGKYTTFIRNSMAYGVAYVALQRIVQNMIRKQRWNDAVKRVESMSICFEDMNAENYNGLIELLKAPVNKKMKVSNAFSPKYNVTNFVVAYNGSKCYYTKVDNATGTKKISLAKSIKGRWAEDTDLVFENIDNENVEVFSLYDNDTKMLIGKNGDIAEAEYDAEIGKWVVTSMFSYPIKSDGYDCDAYMILDQSGMLIVSDRRGGMNLQPSKDYFHGDTALASDIYFVPKKNGVYGWGNIINLGADINTIYCERSPVISKDLKTLYFCSDGHGGLGYCDVYMSERLSTDSWTKWSKPKNIGKVANTGYNEVSLSLSNDERTLYVITDRNGKYEVFSITLDNESSDYTKQVDIYCNRKGERGKNEKILLDIWDIDTRIGNKKYEMVDNKQRVDVFKNKRYVVFSYLEGYFLTTAFISETSSQQIEIDCYKIEDLKLSKQKLPLYISYLDKKTERMDDNAYLHLNYLLKFLENNPNQVIEIISNVDLPSMEEAYYVSVNRADAIKNYLIDNGIDKKRIISSGYGNVNYGKDREVNSIEIRFH